MVAVVTSGRGFEGLGPDAARVEGLLSRHGLSLPEPWLNDLIDTACEEMEHRHHPMRRDLYTDGEVHGQSTYHIADDI